MRERLWMWKSFRRRSISGEFLLCRDRMEAEFIRRSNFQYLEDELNALNARIKAAEERAEGLKRAHAQSGLALGGNETHQQ